LRGRAERPDYVDLLSRIGVPTLVVVGSEDEFTPVGEARLTVERIPGATLAVIDGDGHLPNLERTREFDRALADLLDSVTESAGR
jgi:pimeloyl-ACP methyl ester carboxylesterase